MKPTVMTPSQAQSNGGAQGVPGGGAGSGVNIPINREYAGSAYGSPQQQAAQQQHPQLHSPQQTYGSPRQQFQQVPSNQQQQHFQPTFGFEPDMDNMFPRSHLGRMHDPFAGFGDSRKRSSLHGPNAQAHADDAFQSYFDDADFGFPRFSTMGRRGRMAGGANSHMEHEDDFFNRLPSEFRQYIPDGFGARRGAAPGASNVAQHSPQQHQPQQPQQVYAAYDVPPPQMPQPGFGVPPQSQVPQSPSKRLCDAAIQTEDPTGHSEVDCAPSANLSQHGLRNTVDMGVKSATEQDMGLRAHSAPPPEQQQQNLMYQQQQHQQRPSPGAQQQQFSTQTSPPIQVQYPGGQQQPQPQLKSYYAPQQQTHPQQKQQTPPPTPQTPGGTNVRTIPIFVEGRTEPIINAHKEIPTQNSPPSAQAEAETQAQAQAQSHFAQQQRPTPLNTQQPYLDQEMPGRAAAEGAAGLPPQTPHTLDSINKIQDIQRDVLELMGKVEQFKGRRQDKEYVYLDEMLTRNLLKLDTIDTNGKDSIRLARKEAIKCIQASINVLEAKAEENARAAATTSAAEETVKPEAAAASDSVAAEPVTSQPQDATKIQEPIPLPPPPNTAVADGATAAEAPAEQHAAALAPGEVISGTTTSTSE